MTNPAPIPVAVEPDHDPVLLAAVSRGGGVVVPLDEARVLMWTGGADGFPELPDAVEWVALKVAGIEAFLDAGLLDDRRTWTNAAGFYAENCAEHALGLLLAGVRQINSAVRLGWDKSIDPRVRSLHGSTVTVVGAGGIGRALIPRLTACGARVVAVNTSGDDVPGAERTVAFGELDDVWPTTDHVVLAAPATARTHHLIDDAVLAALPEHCWLVNVARGPLVDEAALYRALRSGAIAGAALDVTDPEPPNPDDELWSLANLILTPHIANPSSGLLRELAPFLTENLRRFAAGEELLSVVPPGRGY
ncbi:MAG: D-isomer specific 2-hydroxyacid dehydrogenase family protein [Gordonia sp. (in: high G+C Gram-positive bacteria)]